MTTEISIIGIFALLRWAKKIEEKIQGKGEENG